MEKPNARLKVSYRNYPNCDQGPIKSVMTGVPTVTTRSPFLKAVLTLALRLPQVFAPTAFGGKPDAAKPLPPPNAVPRCSRAAMP
jgi:hypothetical protein